MGTARAFSELLNILDEGEVIKNGCLVDTSALFALAYEPDILHDQTLEFFDIVAEQRIPLLCNVNIRSEFLELFRRVIFTEALLDFAAKVDKSKLDRDLADGLKRLRKSSDTARSTGRPYRLSEQALKDFKKTMLAQKSAGTNLWDFLCRDRVGSKLAGEWARVEDEFGLRFISTRGAEPHPYLREDLQWENAVKLIENTGMSCADAMICNLFECSTLDFLITNDVDILLAAKQLGARKTVLVPDALSNEYQYLI